MGGKSHKHGGSRLQAKQPPLAPNYLHLPSGSQASAPSAVQCSLDQAGSTVCFQMVSAAFQPVYIAARVAELSQSQGGRAEPTAKALFMALHSINMLNAHLLSQRCGGV